MICPLPEIVQLANQYKYRVMLDESMALGTLGATGRGTCEHYALKASDISIICGSMSTSLASVGGFAVSTAAITAHQRLSSTGYCFSASLPPFNATAASCAIDIMQV
jgi:serine palmitoyltransferase